MKKLFALFGVAFVLFCCASPAFAASGSGDSASFQSVYSHPLGWDSWSIGTIDRVIDNHPFFEIACDDITTWDDMDYIVELWDSSWTLGHEFFAVIQNHPIPGLLPQAPSTVEGFYNIPWEIAVSDYTSARYHSYALYGRNLIWCNVLEAFSACRAAKLILGPYQTMKYSLSIELLVPESKVESNGNKYVELVPVVLTSTEQSVSNATPEDKAVSYMPDPVVFFGDYYQFLKSNEAFIVSSYWEAEIGYFDTPPADNPGAPNGGQPYLLMQTPVRSALSDYSVSLPDAWQQNSTFIQGVSALDMDVTGWMATLMHGFWVTEFLPGLSFGLIFGTLFGLIVLIIVIKIFK